MYVTDEERLVGVVTRKTLVREVVARGTRSESTSLGEIAEPPDYTIGPDVPLEEAFRFLEQQDAERVPVVDGDGRSSAFSREACSSDASPRTRSRRGRRTARAADCRVDAPAARCEDPDVQVCPACGEENPERARFCLACATALAEAPPAGEERKVVSVLFVDLVGFTDRSDRADPEDVRATLRPYHERVKADIERFGGTVEKFIGDAVMAVFGAPVAHEDDAERAVRSALRILDSIDELRAGGLEVCRALGRHDG